MAMKKVNEPVLLIPAKPSMICGHCKRRFGLLHGGSGPMLCCECVKVHRRWEALGGNVYAADDEHDKNPWCENALDPVRRFAEQYAARSGVTLAWLEAQGRQAQMCDCNDKDCEGFQMAHMADWNEFADMGGDYLPPYSPLAVEEA